MPCPCCCLLCTGGTCCGDEYPRHIGVCCDGEWRTQEGVCCDGEWYPAGTEGECCGDEWHTDAGECCDDTWQTGEGECCANVWRTEEGECCGEDQTIIGEAWIPATSDLVCCEVYLSFLGTRYTPATEEDCGDGEIPKCLDAPGGTLYDPPCNQACCEISVACDMVQPEECAGTPKEENCLSKPCEIACCSEDADGVSSCEDVAERDCASPSVVQPGSCTTGCLGECCIDDVSQGQRTQSDCDDLGGCWGGLGSTECAALCRSPLSDACCESKQSSAAGLTFTQPRRRRCPEITEAIRVTVTGTTDSAILIHGTPFGRTETPKKRCAINHTFVICWDSFNIEPVPCGTDFHNLDVEVCWEEEATQSETLNFPDCNDITVWLGACDRDGCVTTLSYTGAGHTSNAGVVLYGDGAIDASGTGALVLTSNITHGNSCARTLTLTGSNQDNNELSGVIENGSGTSVAKTGVGVWRLSGANTYANGLTVLDGTLLVASGAGTSGASPFGTGNPIVGSTVVGISGTAALLLENGVLSERGITVAAAGLGSSQVVVLGLSTAGSGTFSTQNITLNGSVTLQAATGGTATFANPWANGNSCVVTIGSAGNDGTVELNSFLPSTLAGVNIVNGTASIVGDDDRIDPATPVTIGTAIVRRGGRNQTTNDMTVTGIAFFFEAGTYTIATTLSGSGSIENHDGVVVINGTNTMSGPVTVYSGGVVVYQIVSGPAGKVQQALFTNTGLTVAFSSDPTAGDQYKLLAGSTGQTYTPVLTGTAMTGTYDSATSTLTID